MFFKKSCNCKEDIATLTVSFNALKKELSELCFFIIELKNHIQVNGEMEIKKEETNNPE